MENVMDILNQVDCLSIFDLPLGCFVISTNGTFIKCNDIAKGILELPKRLTVENISGFYCQKYNNIDILTELDEHDSIIEKKVYFKVNNLFKWGKLSCSPIFDESHVIKIGYLCFISDITQQERYKQCYQYLAIGTYSLNSNDCFVNVNEQTIKLFGCQNENEILGKNIKDFYIKPVKDNELKELLIMNSLVQSSQVELIKADGVQFFAEINAFRLNSADGAYQGREGTIRDVTSEVAYRNILNTLPLGIYMIELDKNGIDIIKDCNNMFLEMFKFSCKDEVIGYPIENLFLNSSEFIGYKEALRSSHVNFTPLTDYVIQMITKRGEKIDIEVSTQVISNDKGNVIGRAGIMKDVTDLIELKQFREDIGRVLHAYSATLFDFKLTIDATLDIFDDTFVGTNNEFDVFGDDIIFTKGLKLKKNLIHFIEENKNFINRQALSQENWNILENIKKALERLDIIEISALKMPTIRNCALQILEITSSIVPHTIKKETLKTLRRDAQFLQRICCIQSLKVSQKNIVSTDTQVSSLREYVLFNARPYVNFEDVVCKDIIKQNIIHLTEFAGLKKINIALQMSEAVGKLTIIVVERELLLGLDNLLHNAIKYSWDKISGEKYVDIKVYVEDEYICFSYSNFGVAIPEVEIEKGLIFDIGYRGMQSGDRGRLGTGVGLTVVKRVAKMHDGKILITSRPARKYEENIEDYSQPFITQAILKIAINPRS
ncbi:PAS domain-containing protein [bacterium]|nr:PAS domain-containing protein [bacterium]